MSYNSKYTGAEVDAALGKALTALQEHQDISGKQDVINDLAAIRANAAKGATALQSVPSEYVTETELSNKGYATTSAMNTALGNKVDKVSGKGLSTNDYTTDEKNKLAGIAAGATANVGTITGIKMNGASKGTSGVVDLGTVITAHQNISGKINGDGTITTIKKVTSLPSSPDANTLYIIV